MNPQVKEPKRHQQLAQDAKKNGVFVIHPEMTVNEYLLQTYKRETGCTTFRTFKQWKELGFSIIAESKGYPVFSRPIGVLKEQRGKEATTEEMSYFGTAYLFNENQVKRN